MRTEDITGLKFNRLLVLKRVENNKNGQAMYLCKCDCGKTIITRGNAVQGGHSKSCGCLQKERVSKTFYKHGDSFERLYQIWADMNSRCVNNHYKYWHRYGGRGIKVCDEWKDEYLPFKEWAISNGYKENLTLDRVNNNGNYEPSNCKWVTRKEQANNRYTNRFIEFNGEIKDMKQWSEAIGMGTKTLEYRLDHGWTVEDALTKPIDKRYSPKSKKEAV